jgi:hypothetical protein
MPGCSVSEPIGPKRAGEEEEEEKAGFPPIGMVAKRVP